ncbi:MAG: hypothetical protein ACR2KB_02830, partial [Chitinophagaceae bacterium]
TRAYNQLKHFIQTAVIRDPYVRWCERTGSQLMATFLLDLLIMNKKPEDNIPEQEEGAQSNTEASKEFKDVEGAQEFYQLVRSRLLNVNHWHDVAGTATADFQLTDAGGNEVNRSVKKEDYFRINIPGPGSETGGGFDWVRVEDIEEVKNENEEGITIVVRPALNPTNKNPDVAHFFTDEAQSCFMAARKGTKVIAGVFGRNEKPNTKTKKVIDKVRNEAVATGAITGFAKLQWKSLVNGLVEDK